MKRPSQSNTSGALLLRRAEPILNMAIDLRATRSVADLQRLQEQATLSLLDFQKCARADAISPPRIAIATRALAALIDLVVTSMPWGAEAGWQPLGNSTAPSSNRSLLELIHSSASDPDLSELLSVVLLLGFDTRGREADSLEIERLLAQLSDSQVAARADKLTPPQQTAVEHRHAANHWRALWIPALAVAVLLSALYFTLQRSLEAKSHSSLATMANMQASQFRTPRPQPAPKQVR